MKINFETAKWNMDSDGLWLSIKIPESLKETAQEFVVNMQNNPKKHVAEIKPYRKKRSLDANGYYWKLCGELSAKLNIPPVEIYRQHIQNIGNNYEILPLKDDAVEKFCEAWQRNGMGWLTNTLGPSKLEGYTNIIAYYGSSTYDSKQMSQLIDLLVTDCKEQGIETATPEEIERMKQQYGRR
ncbi:MAG TPA: hypothetical protein GX729_07260 [Firmicutes bacterium]|nr:hypothetical protein [Bacillota bacterium]